MEEAQKKKIIQVIKDAIRDVAVEDVVSLRTKKVKEKEIEKTTKEQRKRQVDLDLFFGGDDTIKGERKIKLNEENIIKIPQTEIDNFQKEFMSHLDGHVVKLFSDDSGKLTVLFPKAKDGGIDAVVTGIVDDNIIFKMSIKDGLMFQTKHGNFVLIDDRNKNLLNQLNNLYEQLFLKTFNNLLSNTPEEQTE